MEESVRECAMLEKAEGEPRREIVKFTFAGQPLEGVKGQPIAVALWTNGKKRLSGSSASGIGRAYYCGIGHCYACHVVVDGVPFVRACLTPLAAGMDVQPAEPHERSHP